MGKSFGFEEEESAEEFLGAVLAAVPAFITRLDATYVIRYINLVQRGLLPGSVIGADVFSFIAPESHGVARRCFEGVQRTLEPASYDSVATGPDDTQSTYTNYVAPIDDGERGIGLCIVGVDTTDRLRQQAELHLTEDKLELAVNATGLALWSWDIESGQVEWNERMHELTGQPGPLDLPGYLERVVHPEDREMVRRRGEEALRTGRLEQYRHRILRPDGTVRRVLAMGSLELSETGEPIRSMGGNLDVTEQHRLEERLRETEHRQSLAHLTAGVAHNFNNMLMVMMPTLELLQDKIPAENQDDVTQALAAARRSADMVRQLMTIAGTENRPTEAGSTDLRALLEELIAMTRPVLPPGLVLACEFEGDDLRVAMHPGQLEHVLLNLILNARDALEASSSPRIEVRVHRVRSEVDSESGMVRVEVSDNGTGMSDEVRRSVFEPFFTTKRSQGNGLGLSSARALVSQVGGQIRCESRLGVGSRFWLDLPEAVRSNSEGLPPRPEAEPVACRVLLVDDDDAVRQVVGHILEHHGFEVLGAASVDAAEARLAEDDAREVQVVLLDRSMPGRLGTELLPALSRHLPDAKVLLFSGDPGEAPTGIDGVVAKPVEAQRLLEQIAEVLSGDG